MIKIKKNLIFAFLILLVILSTSIKIFVNAMPITYIKANENIPTLGKIYVYDGELTVYHATIGSPRTPQNLPAGQWYTNINFDPDPSNYAMVVSGKAFLRAYSYAIFIPDCHGWSNAFLIQGRVPYAGGIYEGKFKSGSSASSAIDVDGIYYPLDQIDQMPQQYIKIQAKVTKRYVNQFFAFASVLVFALFQYKWIDGSYSAYDSPQFTSFTQSVHYDLFLSRCRRTFGFYSEDVVGTAGYDWGDAYNGDLHCQYVVGQMPNVGQTYTFTIDWKNAMQELRELIIDAWSESYLNPSIIDGLILRCIGLSVEVVGSELEVEIEYFYFSDTP